MKQLLFFCILFSTLSQAGGSDPLEQRIAYELDLTFSDTVNEGDLRASVAELRCHASLDVARCEALIDVVMLAATPLVSCQKKCSVIYSVKDLEREPTSGYECLRTISEGC